MPAEGVQVASGGRRRTTRPEDGKVLSQVCAPVRPVEVEEEARAEYVCSALMAYLEHWLSTMSLMLRKKRFKFQVDFFLADMCNVPFVNAILYSKIRLHHGGSFCDQTSRADVVNHNVYWGKVSSFVCRIASDPHTGMLEPCICRVSVRKEVRGGRSYQKLGYVDINLSEFAGSGIDGVTRTYLLEGYNVGQQRQDNSLIRVNISMVLLSSDPCFKVPPHVQRTPASSTEEPTTTAAAKDVAKVGDRASVTSASSGFESLNKGSTTAAGQRDGSAQTNLGPELVAGRQELGEHCRNASSRTSQMSQMSDYASSSVSHSRQSSAGSTQQMQRSAMAENMPTIFVSAKGATVKKVVTPDVNTAREFNSSRVDAAELITELLKDYNTTSTATVLDGKEVPEQRAGSRLQLYVSKVDGSAAIAGSSENLPVLNSRRFTQVVMEPPPPR